MSLQLQQDSINDLLSQLNSKLEVLLTTKSDLEQKLKAFAAEIGAPMGFCALPGCGRAFLKSRVTHSFCCPEHKTVFNNKYRRA